MEETSYRLSDIIDNDGAVCIPIVHRGKGLVPFLAGCIPYLKLDCRILVK